MATLIHDCPHCRSTKMAFVIVGVRSLPEPQGHLGGSAIPHRKATVGLQCQQCWGGAASTIELAKSTSTHDWSNYLAAVIKEGVSIPNDKWRMISFWPAAQPPRIPEHLPAGIERSFMQGETNLALPDHAEAAATMFRRALDLTLKAKFPELKGDLNKKITRLADDHIVPQSLAEWAHEVRVIGNDGAHDLEGCSQEDALAARDFVDAVLRYLFSLPGMISARRHNPVGANPAQ